MTDRFVDKIIVVEVGVNLSPVKKVRERGWKSRQRRQEIEISRFQSKTPADLFNQFLPFLLFQCLRLFIETFLTYSSSWRYIPSFIDLVRFYYKQTIYFIFVCAFFSAFLIIDRRKMSKNKNKKKKINKNKPENENISLKKYNCWTFSIFFVFFHLTYFLLFYLSTILSLNVVLKKRKNINHPSNPFK